jgi:D-alanine-D-alanine ligase-like ATP-grasp enzyme
MSDYARIDVRIDAAGRYYFIDPNANPFFGPPKETHATYSMILDMHGVSFEETLKRMFYNTLEDARGEKNGWH